MGDPVYPRLLVNPDKNLVAVIGQDAIDRPVRHLCVRMNNQSCPVACTLSCRRSIQTLNSSLTEYVPIYTTPTMLPKICG